MIHRDIKPENILLESDNLESLEIKITDFGFACVFDPEEGLSQVLCCVLLPTVDCRLLSRAGEAL